MEYKIKIILFEYYFKKIYLKTSWCIEYIYIYTKQNGLYIK